MTKLLYVEDDEIDILTLKRLLKKHNDIQLETVSNFADLQKKDLMQYSAIISDANLPDASYKALKAYFENFENLLFVSGSAIEGENVCVKPITESQVLQLVNSLEVKLDYIKSLADNDSEFEREMIDTALDVLPQRLAALLQAENINELKQAAHKAKSSFRVCGMNPVYLNQLENLSDNTDLVDLQEKQIRLIQSQIEEAIKFLKNI